MTCKEVGYWIQEQVVRPVEQFFERAEEVCEEISKWVEEEIREPIERFREEQEQHCSERKCKKLCLCCNKWFCWFVTILVKFIEWVVRIVGEWVLETICKIITTLIRVIVMVLITILKWIVLFVVCLQEALCRAIIVAACLTILFALLSIAALPVAALTLATLPVAISIFGAALAVLILAKPFCRISWCRFFRIIGWTFKAATVLSGAMALVFLSIGTGMFMAIYGAIVSAIIILLERTECRLPRLFWHPWGDF